MLAYHIGHLMVRPHYWWVSEDGWDEWPIEYCQSKKIDTGNEYTAATIGHTSKCCYTVGTWWRHEKKRTSKKDLATNIPGRFTGDASQLEWCSQSGQWSESVEKSRRPMLQQEWEDLSLSVKSHQRERHTSKSIFARSVISCSSRLALYISCASWAVTSDCGSVSPLPQSIDFTIDSCDETSSAAYNAHFSMHHTALPSCHTFTTPSVQLANCYQEFTVEHGAQLSQRDHATADGTVLAKYN